MANPREEVREKRDEQEWEFYNGDYPMASELCREREMSAMVSALIHVVTGKIPKPSSSEYSLCNEGANCSSSSSAGGGAKRPREADNGYQDFTKLSRPLVDDEFSHGRGIINKHLYLAFLLFLLFFFVFFNMHLELYIK